MEVQINKKKLRIDPKSAIGKGGEADVYDIGQNRALKIFKTPKHPDFTGLVSEQGNARLRIIEQQKKLPKFPRLNHKRVIAPVDLVYQGKKIVGYTMNLIKNAEPIMMYSKKGFRMQGADDEAVRNVFQDMHVTLKAIHEKGLVIGDFNDLNILVRNDEAYFIDTDSWQYANFSCHVFTAKFLDPLLVDKNATEFLPIRPFNKSADWYSFAVMYFQSLLFVDPYGGVYRPKKKVDRLNGNLRPLKRITVFHSEVRYPKPARPYEVLPDDLLHHFDKIFVKDKRGIFPKNLLELSWQTCSKCGQTHARQKCPNCFEAAIASIKESITVRGKVKVQTIFRTSGNILFATWQNGLKFLYHEKKTFYREGERKILSGKLRPGIRYRIQGESTLMGQGQQLVQIDKTGEVKRTIIDSLNNLSMFDTNKKNLFFLQNGYLNRQEEWAPRRIGEVLLGQTLFWIGDKQGFGFYRAGNLSEVFLFPMNGRGLKYVNDFVFPSGQLLDSTCFIADNLFWFLFSVKAKGQTKNYCYLINNETKIVARAEAFQSDGTWLGEIRGKLALVNLLLSATDDGIVRIVDQNGQLYQEKSFPDTEHFVQADSHILAGDNGLYVVGQRRIDFIQLF